MSFVKNNALSAYSQVSLDAKVASASPQTLITMLFDGAIAAIVKAKFHMERVNAGQVTGSDRVESIAEKGKAISKAIAIVEDGLMASLNMEVGGELAGNLYWLYEYLSQRLVLANLHNDVEYLDEVSLRLTELREAWNGMETVQPNNALSGRPTVDPSGVVTYGRV
jgi:flagellar secretion chaperone FliS